MFLDRLPPIFRKKNHFFESYMAVLEKLMVGEPEYGRSLLFYFHPKIDSKIINFINKSKFDLQGWNLVREKLHENGYKVSEDILIDTVRPYFSWRIIDKQNQKIYSIEKDFNRDEVLYGVYLCSSCLKYLFVGTSSSFEVQKNIDEEWSKIFTKQGFQLRKPQVVKEEALFQVSKNKVVENNYLIIRNNRDKKLYVYETKKLNEKLQFKFLVDEEENGELVLKEYLKKQLGLGEEYVINELVHQIFLFGVDSDSFEILYNKQSDKFIVYQHKKILGVHSLLSISPDFFHPRLSFLFRDKPNTYIPALTGRFFHELHNFIDNDLNWFDDFFSWMSKWLALSLKEDWNLNQKRESIARIIPLYRKRGTKEGLENYLQMHLGNDRVEINNEDLFVLGGKDDETAVLGKTTILSINTKKTPYAFAVVVTTPYIFEQSNSNAKRKINDIIEEEAPLHTNPVLYLYNLPKYLGSGSYKELFDKYVKPLLDKNIKQFERFGINEDKYLRELYSNKLVGEHYQIELVTEAAKQTFFLIEKGSVWEIYKVDEKEKTII